MDTQSKLLSNRKEALVKQYKLNAAKDRLKKNLPNFSSIIYCNNDDRKALITRTDEICGYVSDIKYANGTNNVQSTNIKTDGKRLSPLQVNKMYSTYRCSWAYGEKSYVSKPGCIVEVSDGKNDTNIYDIEGFGTRDEKTTISSDNLLVFTASNKYGNIHTLYPYQLRHISLIRIWSVFTLFKSFHYFLNDINTINIPYVYNIGDRLMTHNNLSTYNCLFYNNLTTVAGSDTDAFIKYINSFQPFVMGIKQYPNLLRKETNRSTYVKMWLLNKKSNKSDYKIFNRNNYFEGETFNNRSNFINKYLNFGVPSLNNNYNNANFEGINFYINHNIHANISYGRDGYGYKLNDLNKKYIDVELLSNLVSLDIDTSIVELD